MEALSIHDRSLYERAKGCILRGVPFDIRINADHRHYESFGRMLASFSGLPDDRGPWRSFWDAFRTKDLFAVWGLAVDSHRYNWSWRSGDGAVIVSFSPPAN